jgi:hypothetical protein
MRKVVFLLAVAVVVGFQPAEAQSPMKFFVTSAVGPDVAGPRGIRGADQHCELLGYTAGFGEFQWRAFLDVPAANGQAGEKAVERIGEGPWHNAEGVLVARTPQDLIGGDHNIVRQTALDDKGFTPYLRDGAPAPAEVIASGKPDANGLYFCFAH